MVNFLFPRVVSIARPPADAGLKGNVGYIGAREDTSADAFNTPLFTAVPARIESDRQGTVPTAKLPADAAGQSIWKIMVRLPLGAVQTDDIITSEIEDRYEVISAEWTPLLTTCRCQILQT